MEKIKELIEQQLSIDLLHTTRKIEAFLQVTLKQLNRDGAVIATSGGLDSAVTATLTARSLGAKQVRLLNMPERDSTTIHRIHAEQLAQHLGIPIVVQNISPILRASGTYRLLPLRFIPSKRLRSSLVNFAKTHLNIAKNNLLASRLQPGAETWVAKGVAYAVAKHRIRMAMVYRYAEIHNLMVVGAANRTEWLTGTFSKWGVDHCADAMPMLHIYRSQLEQLAEFVGVPENIRHKAADPDLMPGINDKGALLGNFARADRILCGIELGMDSDALCQIYNEHDVKQIMTLWQLSRHMRESPYHIQRS